MADELDTGEAMHAEPWPDGDWHAWADVPMGGQPVRHHAFGDDAQEAKDLLRYYVKHLRQETAVAPPAAAKRMPMTTCGIIGETRVMACVRPGPWLKHAKPEAVEPRCRACDSKRSPEETARQEAAWARYRAEGGKR